MNDNDVHDNLAQMSDHVRLVRRRNRQKLAGAVITTAAVGVFCYVLYAYVAPVVGILTAAALLLVWGLNLLGDS